MPNAEAAPGPGGSERMPLRVLSTEHRTWTTVRGDGGPLDRPNPMRLRGFVPVQELESEPGAPDPDPRAARAVRPRRVRPARPAVGARKHPTPVDDWEARVSLFGEPDL